MTRKEFEIILENSEYKERYLAIISSNVKSLGHPKSMNKSTKIKGYCRHHIIPKAFGGSNSKNNLVYLTPYQHILAHYYLVLMTKHGAMGYAFKMMLKQLHVQISDIEKITLQDLSQWNEAIELTKKSFITEEGKKKISKKAKQRWQKFRESGRIDEVKENIKKQTVIAMQDPKAQLAVRINLGCKKYYNPETNEERNWYPGMPEFEAPWIRGRRPFSQEMRKKVSETFKKDPQHWYHNDELQMNRTFKESEIIPEGWIKGVKQEYKKNYLKYKQEKKQDEYKRLVARCS